LFWYAAGSNHVFERVHEPVRERKLQPVTQKIGGKRVWLRDKNGDRLYAQSRETRPVGDVWNIPIINPVADERLGYPTQKPEALAARVITACTRPGDIVLDAFAGSGTACATSEKLGRRWVGVDCGKLAIYTIQKRMLGLRENIGNTGKSLKAKPFTLHNAGLYDFSTLKKLPWSDWRFFALQLFGCKDEPHEIGGIKVDGKLKGASVLVFNHHAQSGKRIDEDTIHDIHLAVGKKIGRRFFIIAPRGIFDFQQDYLDFDGIRYYALRIPYSFINELHQRQFSALAQPRDESAVNATVDAVGFDFIQPPTVLWAAFIGKREGGLIQESCIEVKSFESRARVRGSEKRGGMETLSTILIDCDYRGDVFNLDLVFFADELKENSSRAWFPAEKIGKNLMVVFMDIYGNEATDIVAREKFVKTRNVAKAVGTGGRK
jgi:site-specific DNA-methyltransferase (adenine-specific)/adenine-specific DNA-methyltransferase